MGAAELVLGQSSARQVHDIAVLTMLSSHRSCLQEDGDNCRDGCCHLAAVNWLPSGQLPHSALYIRRHLLELTLVATACAATQVVGDVLVSPHCMAWHV